MVTGKPSRQRTCLLYAALAALLVLLWQALSVQFNYGGNWTALFYTGDARPLPPELGGKTYVFKGSDGYDGQFYRYVAHDPFFQKGMWEYIDIPKHRYRRILVPGLAWLLACGQPRFIDGAYVVTVLLFVFLGAYWLSHYALFHAQHPAWGVGFAFVPATLISMDRMTVDVSLAALCVGFAWYARKGSLGRLWGVVALAAFTREIGFFLAAAACGHALWNRRWRRALLFALAVLPALLWYWFVSDHLQGVRAPGEGHLVPAWMFEYPLVGIVLKLLHPERYPLGPAALLVARVIDVLALLGILLALGLALWRLRRRRWDEETTAMLLFAGLTIAVSAPAFWKDVNGYARPITPLLLLVGLRAVSGGPAWRLLPILLVDLRIGVLLGSKALSILHSILRPVL